MKQSDKKVLLFPGTVKLLTNKGRDALSENKAEEALRYFSEALEISPDYYQACLGQVLAYMKLEKYKEALACTYSILKRGLGDYYEVLHIHISLLVSLGKYDEVVTLLEGVLSEGSFPAKYAESFFETLHFARKMNEKMEQIMNTPLEVTSPIEEAIQKLTSDVKEEQWEAIQTLAPLKHDDIIRAFTNFLEDVNNDWILKTFVLKALKEHAVSKRVTVTKLGKRLEVVPKELHDPFQHPFAKKVAYEITERLEQHNPSLKEVALQIWSYYFLSLYPFAIEPENVDLWKVAVEIVALESLAMEFDELEIASEYNLDVSLLLTKVNEISVIHMGNFQIMDFENL